MDEAVLKKLPPHHKESERGVVGAMMLDRDAAIIAIGALTSDDFYLKECAYVFDAVKSVVDEGATVDPTTISNRLIEMNAPAEIASGEFLRNLCMWASTAAVIEQHIDIVKKKSSDVSAPIAMIAASRSSIMAPTTPLSDSLWCGGSFFRTASSILSTPQLLP